MSKKFRRPKRFYTLELGDENDTQIELRLTAEAMDKLEQKTGKKIQEFLETMDEDVIGSFILVLWASRQPFLSGDGKQEENRFTVEDARDLYDDLIDYEHDLMDIQDILKGILKHSGLMPETPVEVEDDEDEDGEETKND